MSYKLRLKLFRVRLNGIITDEKFPIKEALCIKYIIHISIRGLEKKRETEREIKQQTLIFLEQSKLLKIHILCYWFEYIFIGLSSFALF